ncbi:hypothetical protein A2866_06770 [Candidatus Roizmanbacteria bacterium RIFCSPHIGHO2_01_FULL_39_8]|uniref:Nucleotidyltransferase n=1 Tax=Candidatus Roizmanbacteria bacterium RIFCSPHIGHO2_01_FULL_39_8 TaxID=1802033 RepID=A0A1F7GTK3_9BACT|nr:MAG: hypothetical protein A2866_06770 [Candidatus Roizmanbacteria bacterium RIFCSPHIGHO2_01_FULL_39_8]
MTKLEAQYKDLIKVFSRLQEAVKLPSSNIINQDASIQRFEFTFELCWKIMQTIVNENKLDVYGPKNVFREAAKLGIIDDPKAWFDFLKDRNLTVHTYKEVVAREVYRSAKQFVPFVKKLILSVEKYLKK